MKSAVFATAAALALAGLAGCSGDPGEQPSGGNEPNDTELSQANGNVGQDGASAGASVDESSFDFSYSDRDLDPSYDEGQATKISMSGTTAEIDGAGAELADGNVVISGEGVYKLGGSFDGSIVVNADDTTKVQLVLDNATLNGSDNMPAIDVESADKVFITLPSGTASKVSDKGAVNADDEKNAAIWASCDLTIQGDGTLEVAGKRGDGVKTKDDLSMTGGVIVVDSLQDAIVGHDSIKVTKADVTAKAVDGDAMKTAEEDKDDKGFISIDDGSVKLTSSKDDCIDSTRFVRIAGGEVVIDAGDDGINSAGGIRVSGGSTSVKAVGDGIHADAEVVVDDGKVDVTQSKEGIEGQKVTVNGGDVQIAADDDGINAASPDDGSSAGTVAGTPGGDASATDAGMPGAEAGSDDARPQPPAVPSGQGEPENGNLAQLQGQQPPEQPQGEITSDGNVGAGARPGDGGMRHGGGMMEVDENCIITVNGGYVYVNARGDGLDSNGEIAVNGGTVLVNGPENDGNTAVDHGTETKVDGGVLVSLGSAGMYEGMSAQSGQPFVEADIEAKAGDSVALVDSEGKIVASLTAERAARKAVISAPSIEEGAEYKLIVGGTLVGGDRNGYCSDGEVSGGSETAVSGTRESSAAGGFAGGHGDRGAGVPGRHRTGAGGDAAANGEASPDADGAGAPGQSSGSAENAGGTSQPSA